MPSGAADSGAFLRFLLGRGEVTWGQQVTDKLLAVHRECAGRHCHSPSVGNVSSGEINSIVRLGAGTTWVLGASGALLEDKCDSSLPTGFEGGEIRHMRDEFRGDLATDYAMFEENFETATPHTVTWAVFLLPPGGRTLTPHWPQAANRTVPRQRDAPEMPWADREHGHDLSFRSVQEPIPLGR